MDLWKAWLNFWESGTLFRGNLVYGADICYSVLQYSRVPLHGSSAGLQGNAQHILYKLLGCACC